MKISKISILLIVLVFLMNLLPMGGGVYAALSGAWTAYNDCASTTSGNVTDYTITSGSTTGELINFDDGSATGVNVTFDPSGSPAVRSSQGAETNSGTDAYDTFHDKANMAGVISYGDSGWYVDITFTNLDPAKTYTFATTANRDGSSYTTRISRFTLSGDDGATNASTSGVEEIDDHSVYFCTGYNTVNGYVARWTGINPGSDGSFVVRVQEQTAGNQGYGPSVFMLQQESTDPTINISGTPLDAFSSEPGTASEEQNYTVSGTNLTEDIVITAPADFEISLTSGSDFTSSLTLTQTDGTVDPTDIYVHFIRATEGDSSGDITHESSGATTRNVAVSGTAAEPPEGWVAYNDCAGTSSGNVTNFTDPDSGTATGLLVDYYTGENTPVTVTITESGDPDIQTGSYGGSETDPGTDAYVTFHDFIDMAGVYQYGDSGWYVDVTFTGLDPAKTYSFATSANRDGDYSDRIARFTLLDADTATNTSSVGVTRTTTNFSEDTSAFNTGENTAEGYVGSWTNIEPGTDGDFTVRAEADDPETQYKAYAFSVFMLQGEGSINNAPDEPVLVQPLDDATDVSTSPTLEVTVTDPDDDTMNVTFYGREVGTETSEDFTIIVLPDTQMYAQSYPDIFYSQTAWIVDQLDDLNIVYVAHEGDIVNTASSTSQWDVADEAMDDLEDPVTTGLTDGIPYGMLPGNHDQPTTNYNIYFGYDRFEGRGYYGGHYSTNNDNNYGLFSAGGMDFIVINLQYNPTTAILTWADGLLDTYNNRRGIVVSHSILDTDGSWEYEAIYTALENNPNLFLLLCGHMHGVARRTDTGSNGNTIYTLLADYQSESNGGNGYLRIMRFSPTEDKIYVETYSPYTYGNLTDSDNEFELDYDMDGSGSFEVLGTVSGVTSGSNASLTWLDLDPVTQYEWYVEVSDSGATTTGATWDFTTTDTTYTLTVNTVGSGSVDLDPTGGSYTAGTEVELTATADVGWSFSDWSGDLISTTNPDNITMDGDKNVTATFTEDEYTLTVSTVGNGTVAKNPDQATYHYGDVVQLTGVPDTGWSFSDWDGDLISTTNPDNITMDGDKNVTATFTINDFAVRDLPAAVVDDTTFQVTIQFIAPDDDFNSIGLTDLAPEGWVVTADKTWCTPVASENNTPEINKVEYTWFASYSAGTTFTVVYNVTVPAGTTPGTYSFPDGQVEYYIGYDGPFTVPISGDNEVGWGGVISGVTAQVDGTLIPGATVELYLDGDLQSTVTSGPDGQYELVAIETGEYTVVASAAGFRDETQSISVPALDTDYTQDFIGNHGLVPDAPEISYVLACANKWLYPPAEHPELALTMSKVLAVVNAWLYPGP